MSPSTAVDPLKAAGLQLIANSEAAFNRTGEVEIAGRRYITAERLSGMLGVTVRTLARWNAARRGPPRIKVGRLVLFDIGKLPAFLAGHETEPIRARRKLGRPPDCPGS